MSNYTTLLGAEDVARAGHNMQAAADQMQRAANQFDESITRLIRAMEEHATRIEAAQGAAQS